MPKLETVTNAVVIIVCLIIGGEIVSRHLGSPRVAAPLSAELNRFEYQPGDVLNLAPLALPADSQSMVFVVTSTCGFCRASLPFYRRLSTIAKAKGVRRIGVCLEGESACKAFFEEGHVEVDAIASVRAAELKIGGTPTLILVGSHQKIARVWKGQLTDMGERAVMAAIGVSPST